MSIFLTKILKIIYDYLYKFLEKFRNNFNNITFSLKN